MANLTITARIEAKADSVDRVKSELLKLIAPTREEEGCVQYDLHQDNSDPAVFLFVELWASRELWQAHMANENLKAFMAATDGAIESLAVNEMTQIG